MSNFRLFICYQVVLSITYGKHVAIAEAEKLQLTNNHFYFTLLGELYNGVDNDKSRLNFHRALALAKTAVDKRAIQKKIDEL